MQNLNQKWKHTERPTSHIGPSVPCFLTNFLSENLEIQNQSKMSTYHFTGFLAEVRSAFVCTAPFSTHFRHIFYIFSTHFRHIFDIFDTQTRPAPASWPSPRRQSWTKKVGHMKRLPSVSGHQKIHLLKARAVNKWISGALGAPFIKPWTPIHPIHPWYPLTEALAFSKWTSKDPLNAGKSLK